MPILDGMQLWKKVEETLVLKYFLLVPLFIGILAATTTLSSLRDQTHEIERVGSAWINDGAILYAQAWSHHSPQTLFFGALYSNYAATGFAQIVVEVLFVGIVGILLWANLRLTMPGKIAKQRALLLLASCSLLIPGSWQLGVTPAKIALLSINIMIFGYFSWKKSGESYWLLGKTSKNWRYLLLAGTTMSLTIYTSWFYTLFVLPIIVDFAQYLKPKRVALVRWTGLMIIPIIAESWVWISVLSPRNLLGLALENSVLDIRIFGSEIGLFRNSWALILSTIVLVICALVGVRAVNLRKNPSVWTISLVIIIATLFFPAGILQSTVILIAFGGLIYSEKAAVIVRPAVMAICAVFLLLASLPLRTLLQKQLELDIGSGRLAASYVDQRLVDTVSVYYYGSSAGFYELSGFNNPTRFYDAKVFNYDSLSLGLEAKFRGDMEADAPLFVVYATGERTKVEKVDRLEEYFAKHYAEVASIEGYTILKRK